MAFKAVQVNKFGGLKSSTDVSDVGIERATVAQNVELAPDLSYVATRPGTVNYSLSAATGTGDMLALTPRGKPTAEALIASTSAAGTTVFLDTITSGGTRTAIGSWAAGAGVDRISVALHGTPLLTHAYFANENYTLRVYTSGSVLTTSVGAPRCVCAVPVSNRMAQGHYTTAANSPTGANGSPHTVFFSDPGLPDTFSANNFVQVTPGDGEVITNIIAWREQLFVFKQTRMFVFSGEGTDSTGQPIFNYRSVRLSGHISDGTQFTAVAAGLNGVYYVADDGVYRTTGGPPVKISRDLDASFASAAAQGLSSHLSVTGDRVFLSSLTGTVFMMDERHGQWVLWVLPGNGINCPLVELPLVAPMPGRPFYFDQGTGFVRQFLPSATTDPGSVIISAYQSGLSDFGLPASLKSVRQTQVWGTGTINYSMAVDYIAADTAAALVLGASPTADDAYDRTARRGTMFGFRVGANSGAWRVNRLSLQVGARWPVGVQQ